MPQPTSSTFESGTISSNTRRWLPEGGLNQIAVFLRDQLRTTYDGAHANALGAAFDGYAIKITSDAAGNTLLSNATFTNSSGTAETCANSCTGTNALDTRYFTIPDAHTGAVYIHLSVNKANKLDRAVSLKWDAPADGLGASAGAAAGFGRDGDRVGRRVRPRRQRGPGADQRPRRVRLQRGRGGGELRPRDHHRRLERGRQHGAGQRGAQFGRGGEQPDRADGLHRGRDRGQHLHDPRFELAGDRRQRG